VLLFSYRNGSYFGSRLPPYKFGVNPEPLMGRCQFYGRFVHHGFSRWSMPCGPPNHDNSVWKDNMVSSATGNFNGAVTQIITDITVNMCAIHNASESQANCPQIPLMSIWVAWIDLVDRNPLINYFQKGWRFSSACIVLHYGVNAILPPPCLRWLIVRLCTPSSCGLWVLYPKTSHPVASACFNYLTLCSFNVRDFGNNSFDSTFFGVLAWGVRRQYSGHSFFREIRPMKLWPSR